MKNVKPHQMKKCIFLTQSELEVVLSEILQKTVTANVSLYGLDVCTEDEHSDDIDNCAICDALSKHFDVQVTSIHIDDCDLRLGFTVGVWVAYEDKEVD